MLDSRTEIEAVVAALHKHAEETNVLAARISQLLASQPTGLSELPYSETIEALLKKGRAAFPEYSGKIVTRITYGLRNAGIRTIEDLRREMHEHGRPDAEAEISYWLAIPNVGKKSVAFLAKTVKKFRV